MDTRHAVLSFALVALSISCSAPEPLPPRVVRLIDSTVFNQLLAKEYARRLPGVRIDLVEKQGKTTLQLIESGEADLAVILALDAYFWYVPAGETTTSSKQLRGLAVVPELPMHVVVRAGSGIRDVAALRGRRIISCAGCLTFRSKFRLGHQDERSEENLPDFIGYVLQAYGIEPSEIDGEILELERVVDSLVHGTHDAAFVNFYYPAPVVTAALQAGATLLPLDGPEVERLRLQYPFVRTVLIPAGTYPAQTEVFRTIGIDRLLVTRRDLDEVLAYELTKVFVEALPQLSHSMTVERFGSAAAHISFGRMEMERAPVSPIPLHDGAARFFREWELFR